MNFDTKIVKIVLVKTMLYMAVVEESLVQSRIYYKDISAAWRGRRGNVLLIIVECTGR